MNFENQCKILTAINNILIKYYDHIINSFDDENFHEEYRMLTVIHRINNKPLIGFCYKYYTLLFTDEILDGQENGIANHYGERLLTKFVYYVINISILEKCDKLNFIMRIFSIKFLRLLQAIQLNHDERYIQDIDYDINNINDLIEQLLCEIDIHNKNDIIINKLIDYIRYFNQDLIDYYTGASFDKSINYSIEMINKINDVILEIQCTTKSSE